MLKIWMIWLYFMLVTSVATQVIGLSVPYIFSIYFVYFVYYTVWIIPVYSVFWFIPWCAYPWKITPRQRGGILSGFSRFYKYLYIKWFCFDCRYIGIIYSGRGVLFLLFFFFISERFDCYIQSILRSSLLRFTVSSLDELFWGGISIYYSDIDARLSSPF